MRTDEPRYPPIAGEGTGFEPQRLPPLASRGGSTPLPPNKPNTSPPRQAALPWVRFAARLIDMTLCAVVVGIAVALIAPGSFSGTESQILLSMLIAFIWVFIEASFLSSWGTTPGKWLFKTTLQTHAGAKLDFRTALGRSFAVYVGGIGLAIPVASFITTVMAYRMLRKHGETLWDQQLECLITHRPVGVLRGMLALLCLVGAVVLWRFGR